MTSPIPRSDAKTAAAPRRGERAGERFGDGARGRRPRLLAIVGPTAAGKTDMAMRLAERLPSEIVSADSRQVYRRMDIGSAKPTRAQLERVRHHLIDIIDPDEMFSVGQFVVMAKQAIQNANEMKKLPIIAGGTGQYVMSILEGWNVPSVEADPNLRQELENLLDSDGADALIERLRALDPLASETVDARNPRRLIRAIERASAGYRTGDEPRKTPPPFDCLAIGLHMERPELYRRIDERVERMVAAGFVEEVESLLAAGFDVDLPSMSGIGYREMAEYLRGDTDLDDAIRRTKFRTHRYARSQYNWFKRDDRRIRWIESSRMDDGIDAALEWIDDGAAGDWRSDAHRPK